MLFPEGGWLTSHTGMGQVQCRSGIGADESGRKQLRLQWLLLLPLSFKSPLSAPCRRCLERIRCGVCRNVKEL